MNGLSITLVFGSYGGFHIKPWRLCLGWVALSVYGLDIEVAMEQLMLQAKRTK